MTYLDDLSDEIERKLLKMGFKQVMRSEYNFDNICTEYCGVIFSHVGVRGILKKTIIRRIMLKITPI